jgi:hypothetical protein
MSTSCTLEPEYDIVWPSRGRLSLFALGAIALTALATWLWGYKPDLMALAAANAMLAMLAGLVTLWSP